jgi:hypothetical protein
VSIPVTSSVPQKIASQSAEGVYYQYKELIKKMGGPAVVPYSVHGLAKVQSAMISARRHDRYDQKVIEEDHWFMSVPDNYMDFEVDSADIDPIYFLHPIHTFYEHIRGFDEPGRKFIDLYARGDTSYLPLISEGGEVYFLCTSFHKGDFSVSFAYFPKRPFAVKEELYELLKNYETR